MAGTVRGGLSRRGLISSVGAGAALAGGLTAAFVGDAASSGNASAVDDLSYPFEGAHQAGIVTPAQDRLHFAAFDLDPRATRD
ncbi:MAG: hypothetical protein WAS07_04240, partial [Micropruina sp.]